MDTEMNVTALQTEDEARAALLRKLQAERTRLERLPSNSRYRQHRLLTTQRAIELLSLGPDVDEDRSGADELAALLDSLAL